MDSTSGRIRNLFKHSLIYGVGLFLKKALGFFLIPLYTHQFTHLQYGKLAILYLYSSALVILFSLGLNDAFFKQFTEEKDSRESVFGRFFLFRLLSVSIMSFIFFILSDNLSPVLLGTEDSHLLKLATITIWIEALITPALLTLRVNNRSKKFVVVNTIRFLFNIGFNILFVMYYRMGVGGVMMGNLFSAIVFFMLLYPEFHKYFKPEMNLTRIKELLTYGLPLLPLSFLILGLDLADRWIIKWMSGLDRAGIYTLGYQFGAVMSIIVHGFRTSWVPFFFNFPDARQKFADTTLIFLRVSLILWGALTFFTPEIFQLMVADKFHIAIPIVPIIAFSYIVYGLEEIFTAGFFIKSKTILLIPITFIALSTNVILNLILIPHIDIMGAAISTVISFSVFAVISYFIAESFFPVPYSFKRIFIEISVAIILYIISIISGSHAATRIVCFIILLLMILLTEKERIKSLYVELTSGR